MIEKIVVPLMDNKGLESKLSGHLGRAPFLGVVTVEDQKISKLDIASNKSEHFGGRGKTAMNILSHEPNAVILLSCGPGAIQNFQQRKIAVLTGPIKTLQEAIEGYVQDTLQELTEGCKEHRH